MKAILLSEHGGQEQFKFTETKEPEIESPNEVKVRLKAAGINPLDTKLRSGAYPLTNFPVVLGCDGAGIVEACGSNVTRLKEGDEVYFFYGVLNSTQGNYAEKIVLDERFVAQKAKSQNFIEAAASPLILLTAWEALFDRANLKEGQTVFINAGAGGVGHVAIQLAKSVGAKVCTTISNKEKADFVKQLGADLVINYKEDDVERAIMEWTDGNGVDVALDNIGGAETQKMFSLVRFYGQLVSLLLPGNDIDWTLARFRNLSFSFEVMLSPLKFDLKEAQEHQTEILENCARLIDDGKLKVHVSEVLPLEQTAKAHELIEEGHTIGKIVLEI